MPDRDAMREPLPLVEGQWLDQPTFHLRYEAMPPGTRAELINGVAFMPEPFGVEHGKAIVPVTGWLAHYAEQARVLDATRNATTILGPKNELQPDLSLLIPPEFGGQIRIEAGWLQGPPELVVEVTESTRYIDLGPKFDEYERAGVREYVVRALGPDAVYWFVLRDGRLEELPPGPDGIYRSEVFPGLWLDPQALIRGDGRRLRAVVELGCATPEHAAFVARLAAARGQAQGQGPA
jgi:Uma2 family endonuclease